MQECAKEAMLNLNYGLINDTHAERTEKDGESMDMYECEVTLKEAKEGSSK